MNSSTSSFPATSTPGSGPTRAVVLGGGGSTGNAWLIGVAAGLAESDVHLADADLIVGTSAGATAAVQISGAPLPDLYALTTAPVSARHTPPGSSGRGRAIVSTHLDTTAAIIGSAIDADDMRRRMGAAAAAADDASEGNWSGAWRSTVAARLPMADWPVRSVFLTAVDARSGEPVVFERGGQVALVDAVAASCAGGPNGYRIGDALFIDGGYRRNENADLAAGHDRIVVIAPFGGRSRMPADWGMDLYTQVAELRAAGSRVEVIVPEPESEFMFGPNAMDLSLRPAAAVAGHRLGTRIASGLGEFWR